MKRMNSLNAFGQNSIVSAEEGGFKDYINASYINSCLDQRLFIAAMAPPKNYIGQFWQMIFENNTGLIMMLCCLKGNQCDFYFGKPAKEVKENRITFESDKYWTPDRKQEFTVEVVKEKSVLQDKLIKRKLKVTRRENCSD